MEPIETELNLPCSEAHKVTQAIIDGKSEISVKLVGFPTYTNMERDVRDGISFGEVCRIKMVIESIEVE